MQKSVSYQESHKISRFGYSVGGTPYLVTLLKYQFVTKITKRHAGATWISGQIFLLLTTGYSYNVPLNTWKIEELIIGTGKSELYRKCAHSIV